MWRQGDVLISRINQVPEDSVPQHGWVLAEGELTGHAHRIADPGSAVVFKNDDFFFVRVVSETAIIVHEEHGPITLEKGVYRVWRQREYVPGPLFKKKTRQVRD